MMRDWVTGCYCEAMEYLPLASKKSISEFKEEKKKKKKRMKSRLLTILQYVAVKYNCNK